jgi:4-carboxymuconolactone decarboxylase
LTYPQQQDAEMSDAEEKGYAFFNEVMGPEAGAKFRGMAEAGGYGSDITKLAAAYAFGSVWSREGGLSRKERSIAVISALIGQHFKAELKNHVRIGLVNGLTAEDFESILVQLVPYVGFPAIAQATESVVEVLREKGIDTKTQTSTERGLL